MVSPQLRKLFYALALLLCLGSPVFAQQSVRSFTTSAVAADAGILQTGSGVGYHELTWTTSGTVSTCTVALDTSVDGISWSAGGAITGQTCTSNGHSAVTAAVANYVRINVTAISGGGSVSIAYDGWVTSPGSGSGNATSIQSIAVSATPPSGVQCLQSNAGDTQLLYGSCSAASGANAALSNLAAVAINTTLLPGAAGAENLGTALLPFGDLFIGGSASHAADFNVAGLTANRTFTVPDAAGTFAVSASSPLSLSATGGLSCATCVTSASALASNAVVIGGGLQASSTISADTTTTHALFATAGAPAFRAIAPGDIPTLNQNTTGSAATWTTARNLAGNSVNGSADVPFANKFIVQGTTDAGLSGAQFLGALGTGILKNTTSTGVLSLAIASDFPTLNQNTTGTAANVTGVVAPVNGGTGLASPAAHSLLQSEGAGNFGVLTAAGYAGVAQSLSCVTGSDCTIAPEGAPVDTQSSATPTVLLTDRLGVVNLTNNTTSTAVTVPQSGATNFDQSFGFAVINSGTVIATLTPTTSNVNGNTTLKIPAYLGAGFQPAGAIFYGDNTNYHAVEISQKDANGLIPNADLTSPPVLLTVASDFTDSTTSTLKLVTGLSTTMPVSKAVVISAHCQLLFDQATAVASDSIGIGVTGTAPTSANAGATAFTSASTQASGTLVSLASTTPTAVVTFTPSAITTVWRANLDATIEQPSNATPGVFGVYVSTATGADNFIVKRGSYCSVVYQ